MAWKYKRGEYRFKVDDRVFYNGSVGTVEDIDEEGQLVVLLDHGETVTAYPTRFSLKV